VPVIPELRVYEPHEIGRDGYPFAWHRDGTGRSESGIKHHVRDLAGHRCVRCHHPYRTGQSSPEWSQCDYLCTHGTPVRIALPRGVDPLIPDYEDFLDGHHGHLIFNGRMVTAGDMASMAVVWARWRVLTVHHLTGVKADCRPFNLCALCQRCHLEIQGRVNMEQLYVFEHSEWFKPYAAAWYALKYEGRTITLSQAGQELDRLLSLERMV